MNGEPITCFGDSQEVINRNDNDSSWSMKSYCVRENQEYFKSFNAQKENSFEKNKSLVKKDKEIVFLYLLCIKEWTKKTMIHVPKCVTHTYIIPKLCFHITSAISSEGRFSYNNQALVKPEELKVSIIADIITYHFPTKK